MPSPCWGGAALLPLRPRAQPGGDTSSIQLQHLQPSLQGRCKLCRPSVDLATSGSDAGPSVSYLAAVRPSTHLRSARSAEDPVLVQEAKAEGLGPRHSLQAARQVLAEPFLSEFTAEVASAEETGWFWKYQLGLLEVSWPAVDRGCTTTHASGAAGSTGSRAC